MEYKLENLRIRTPLSFELNLKNKITPVAHL